MILHGAPAIQTVSCLPSNVLVSVSLFLSLKSGRAPSAFRQDYGPQLTAEEADEKMKVRHMLEVEVNAVDTEDKDSSPTLHRTTRSPCNTGSCSLSTLSPDFAPSLLRLVRMAARQFSLMLIFNTFFSTISSIAQTLTQDAFFFVLQVLKGQIDARDDAKAGSASYKHCLHRVRTMSDAQLERRVRGHV